MDLEKLINNDLFRLSLSFLLGASIGTERQIRRKMAGMRTNALVAVGATLFVLLGVKNATDPSSAARIAAQIASGIGFLGAGVIMKEGFTISGLNTAATIWCAGAIGALCGMGYWQQACMGTFFILLAHLLLRPLGKQVVTHFSNRDYTSAKYIINVICNSSAENRIRDAMLNILSQHSLHLLNISIEENKAKGESVINMQIASDRMQNERIEEFMKKINADEAVSSAQWELDVETY